MLSTKAIQKVNNVCAYSLRTCFVAADHWLFVFSLMLKSCIIQLYVGPCHVVSAEIAVAMAVPIENPADSESRGFISFLQGKFSRGIVLLHDNARPYTARQSQALLREQFHWNIFEHPPYSPDLVSSGFFLFPKMEQLAGKRFAYDEGLKDAG